MNNESKKIKKSTPSNIRRQQVLNQIKKEIEQGKDPKVYNVLKKTPENWDSPPKGNPIGKCKICGNEFEQDYIGEYNRYTSYELCKKCSAEKEKQKRIKDIYDENKKKENNKDDVYNSFIDYQPFPAQLEMHKAFENHRFMVLDCGNRFGKDRFTTMAGIMYFVDCLNENRHIERPDLVPTVYWWIVAPTERMAKQNWMEIKKFFPKDWVVNVSDSTLTMQTIGGGVIEVRSAFDPESLVGVGLDLVTITEAARIRDIETVWANLEARLSSPGRGRLKDRGNRKYGMGKAIINSSPIRKNGFYRIWCWGQKSHPDYSSNWISFKFPWTANPANEELAKTKVKTRYGVITYEEDLKRRIGERLYRQNYLAEFLDTDGSVFKDFEDNCVVNTYSNEFNFNDSQRKEYIDNWQKPIPYREYRVSWDIATGSSGGDTPAVVIRDMVTNNIVRVFSLMGKRYEEQYDTIAYWCKFYNNSPVVFSSTGHTPAVGQLEKRGVQEIVINEQAGKKAEYVQNLEKAVQNKDIHVLYDGSDECRELIFEMNDYTETNGKYSNNESAHDDYVSALYLNYYDYGMQSTSIFYSGLMGTV